MSTDAPKAPSKQVVFLVGKSRGAEHGDRRSLDAEEAEQLVSLGLARYPDSKE